MSFKDNTYMNGIFLAFENEEIDWKNELGISYSQYSSYKACPKKWELQYIQKKKPPYAESIYGIYGTAMHYVLQEYIKEIYTNTAKSADELPLDKMLMEQLKLEYSKAIAKNNNEHFSSPGELGEFYADGIEIIKYVKSKRSLYFPRKTMELIAIELPIVILPDPNRKSLKMQMYLDLILYDKYDKKYVIIDIKTSKKGWNEYNKKDKTKTDQLLLYKNYFSKKFGISQDDIDVKFFILRQKIDPDSVWPIKRIQEFVPSNGKISMSKTMKEFNEFINECFDENGKYKTDRVYPAFAGKQNWNCKFCEFADHEDLCPSNNRIT